MFLVKAKRFSMPFSKLPRGFMKMREVPLLNLHKALGASLGIFAGVKTAMDYGNALEEHIAVRNSVGVFDITHMGRIAIKGPDAYDLLNYLVPKDISKSQEGRMIGPTAFLNEKAGFKDDVMLYNMGNDNWMLVCNAINIEKIYSWLKQWTQKISARVTIENLTETYAMLAIQGPKSADLISTLGFENALDLKHLQFITDLEYKGGKVFLISRSGWTGEDGFEIIAKPNVAECILKEAIKKGARPCGLIARDSLRLEMGFVLYDNDIDENTTPLEARYWVFTPSKTGYVGYEALAKQLEEGVKRVKIGIRMKKGIRVIPRRGYEIVVGNKTVGKVTSGTFSPILRRSIAMGYVNSTHALMGLEVKVIIRGKKYPGKLVDFPFIKKR